MNGCVPPAYRHDWLAPKRPPIIGSAAMRMKRKTSDRRANRRYDVTLEVRWKVVHRKRVLYSGTGLTVNFSSGGIQFETSEPPSVGRTVEMAIAWPALLDDSLSLRLFVQGRVVRTTGQRVAVDIDRYEFRTAP